MAKTKKSKKSKKESTLYYFYSQGCGFCKRIEPMVDKLNKDGYDILKLDLKEKDNKGLKKEIEKKYEFNCGTPLLVDADTGYNVCGYREEDIVKKWADGEKIELPPSPNSPPPPPPKDYENKKEIEIWKEAYTKWREENKHVPTIPDTDDMLGRLKKRKEMQQNSPAYNPNPEARLTRLEQKMDKLMKHLGVK
jgi:thiol-disulfide isomerase/thioredoxin